MAAGPAAPRKQFALDTNILIDLGEEKPFAQAFLAAYLHRGLCCPPTVIQELTSIAFDTDHHATQFAYSALANMRQWGIAPFDLISVGHGITEVNAKRLIERGILPEGELNDGLILIETALCGIPSLVTSDKHLLEMDKPKLLEALSDFHLTAVQVFHPKDLLRAVS